MWPGHLGRCWRANLGRPGAPRLYVVALPWHSRGHHGHEFAGTRESGIAWGVPTYLFVISLGFVLAWGTYRVMASGGQPQPIIPPPAVPHPEGVLTVWLLLRAFASGCTAMTGVEAVSNGVSAFREPKVRQAHGTLAAIVIILALLLLGIAHLAGPMG